MVLEENIRVSGVSLSALLGGKGVWRCAVRLAQLYSSSRQGEAQQRGKPGHGSQPAPNAVTLGLASNIPPEEAPE